MKVYVGQNRNDIVMCTIFIYYIIGVVIEFILMTIFCKGCIAVTSDDAGYFCDPYTIEYKDILCIALVPFPFSLGACILDCYYCIKHKCNYEYYQYNKKDLILYSILHNNGYDSNEYYDIKKGLEDALIGKQMQECSPAYKYGYEEGLKHK